MQRCAICFAEDYGSANGKFAAGAKNADSDFSAIGDKNFSEHASYRMQRNSSMRLVREFAPFYLRVQSFAV